MYHFSVGVGSVDRVIDFSNSEEVDSFDHEEQEHASDWLPDLGRG